MIVIIHSSKTMRPALDNAKTYQKPKLIDSAKILDQKLKTLSTEQLMKIMKISEQLADKTHNLISSWTDSAKYQRPAIDSFLGDIYSGLQSQNWTTDDRIYANQKLRIISGLYGILKPLDGIFPYRLEMGYKLPINGLSNLYSFWSDKIAKTLQSGELIINLSAKEYSRVLSDYIDKSMIVSPIFLTLDNASNELKFIIVHAKIARGAFANWIIKNRIENLEELYQFSELNYKYDPKLSSINAPAFVCESFGGLGLSVRLK